MKDTTLFKTGRSLAVRIPKEWVKGVHNVRLKKHPEGILICPQRKSLGEIAEECAQLGNDFPDRLPQSKTDIRWTQ